MSTRHLVPILFALTACGDTSGGGPPDDEDRIRGYLRASPYRRLVLEVDVVPGAEPRASAESGLVQGLGGVIAKPGGVAVTRDKALTSRGAGYAWSFADLDALARSTFDLEVPADTIKMHVLYLDGHYVEDTADQKVLGLAWSQRHLVMFQKTLESTCSTAVLPLVRERFCASAELSVWTHETGHLLGLVDNGLKMVQPHKDADAQHGNHDQSDQCVMYWAYEGQQVIDLLKTRFGGGDESALGFDAACLADVAAVRDAP